VPAWIAKPNGYIFAFALFAFLLVAQGINWAERGARTSPRPDGLKGRLLSGMQQSNAGRRWLRHPWLVGSGIFALAVLEAALFNALVRL